MLLVFKKKIRGSHVFFRDNKASVQKKKKKKKRHTLLCIFLASFHGLKEKENLNLEILNHQLERVSETRLLGVKFQENLKWNDHVKGIANASYGVLRTFRKLKHFADPPM